MMSRLCLALSAVAAIAALFAAPARAGAQDKTQVNPFHSEIEWYRLDQLPVPDGRCTDPLPEGLAYLWVSHEYGTATSTHLGIGPYYAEFCVYGLLTAPGEAPPNNGTPLGFNGIDLTWTAANGDTLKASASLVGVIPTPVLTFVCSVAFVDGGTGRFARAEGRATALIYPDLANSQVGREVHDGWIRYKRW